MTGCMVDRCQNKYRCRDIGQCALALEADGEKLRQITGEDHGPHFVSASFPCAECSNHASCIEHRKCWLDWAKYHYFEYEDHS